MSLSIEELRKMLKAKLEEEEGNVEQTAGGQFKDAGANVCARGIQLCAGRLSCCNFNNFFPTFETFAMSTHKVLAIQLRANLLFAAKGKTFSSVSFRHRNYSRPDPCQKCSYIFNLISDEKCSLMLLNPDPCSVVKLFSIAAVAATIVNRGTNLQTGGYVGFGFLFEVLKYMI